MIVANPMFDNDVKKVRTFTVGPSVPCIDCITLPICKAHILKHRINVRTLFVASSISRPAILKLYETCSLVKDYVYSIDKYDPKYKGYENSYLLQKVITYIITGKFI